MNVNGFKKLIYIIKIKLKLKNIKIIILRIIICLYKRLELPIYNYPT